MSDSKMKFNISDRWIDIEKKMNPSSFEIDPSIGEKIINESNDDSDIINLIKEKINSFLSSKYNDTAESLATRHNINELIPRDDITDFSVLKEYNNFINNVLEYIKENIKLLFYTNNNQENKNHTNEADEKLFDDDPSFSSEMSETIKAYLYISIKIIENLIALLNIKNGLEFFNLNTIKYDDDVVSNIKNHYYEFCDNGFNCKYSNCYKHHLPYDKLYSGIVKIYTYVKDFGTVKSVGNIKKLTDTCLYVTNKINMDCNRFSADINYKEFVNNFINSNNKKSDKNPYKPNYNQNKKYYRKDYNNNNYNKNYHNDNRYNSNSNSNSNKDNNNYEDEYNYNENDNNNDSDSDNDADLLRLAKTSIKSNDYNIKNKTYKK